MMRYYLLNDDRTFREVDDMIHWAEGSGLVAGAERRNVGDDELQGYRVSTKFIGLDTTPLGMNRPPRPFETMIFGPHGYTEVFGRWTSWAEAERMHATLMSYIFVNQVTGQQITRSRMDLAQRMARLSLE